MLTNDLIDEAYAEKAVREENRRERPIDLSERAPLGTAPLDTGDDPGREHDPLAGEAEHNADRVTSSVPTGSRVYRGNPDVYNDLVGEGHGFVVARFSNVDRPDVCRYCGDRLLPPDDTSACEFATTLDLPGFRRQDLPDTEGVRVRYRTRDSAVPVKLRDDSHPPVTVGAVREYLADHPAQPPRVAPPRTACRCNACTVRHDGRRKRGGQEIACYSPACRQRLADDQREQNRRTEARRKADQDALHRAAAKPMIRADPSRSDRDIAAELSDAIGEKVPIVRVREARKSLGLNP